MGGGTIAVVGCGNPTRQDDGVGPQVVSELKRRGLEGPQVKLLDAGTDGMAVMFAARGCTSLIVVDAACTGVEAGAIYEVPGAELARPHLTGYNLHDFRWDGALHAGRQIFGDDFPDDVRVFLVEAGELGFGVGLSPAVSAAAAKVSLRIETLISQRTTAGSVGIRRGGLYVSAALCDRCLAGLEAVVLLKRNEELRVLPVRHAASGGYLLKRRNSMGDRVVFAPNFFRENGLGEDTDDSFAAYWNPVDASLVIPKAFAN